MKKMICVLAVLMSLVCCLSACNFTGTTTGLGTAQSTAKVEEMMAALAKEDVQEALAMMHPDVKNPETAIRQMADYLAGRTVKKLTQLSITVNTSTGTGGSIRQEQVSYQAELDDGSSVFVAVVYRTEGTKAGFVSFQIVLGIV